MNPNRTTSRTRSRLVAALVGLGLGLLVGLLVDLTPEADGAPTAPTPRRAAPTTVASCYGPGLYGNPTANGTILRPSTVGIAHRTLPLGTVVRIGAGIPGRTAEVRVIDRGPYHRDPRTGRYDRTWDVTERLAQVLGFRSCRSWGVRKVRVVVLRRPRA